MMKLVVCVRDSNSECLYHPEAQSTEQRLFMLSKEMVFVIIERDEDV